MNKLNFSLLFSALTLTASAQTVVSPDGNTTVQMQCGADGVPTYSIVYKGNTLIEPSPLGLNLQVGDYTKGMTLKAVSPDSTVTDSYSLPNIKKSSVDYKANRRTFTFADSKGRPVYDIEWQVSDNNAAFRYRLHPRKDWHGTIVQSEASSFTLPAETTTFICPQSTAMEGWCRTYPSYETEYVADDSMGKNGVGHGYTFPCLFHAGNKGWVLISETGVDANYCASALSNGGGARYYVSYPQSEEMRGAGTSGACVTLPGYTPWRTITMGTDLAPIVETTIPFDLVRPKYAAKHAKDYGKGTWSWIIGMEPSMNYDEQKRYIDFTADMGYETLLVDALWDTQVGYDKIEELAKYAKSKGVDFYLWYNSNGTWNDAPQTPRDKMNNAQVRRAEMAWMKKIGVRGIKVDFFGADKQDMIKLYEDILNDANDYGLLVIFHGCTLPRGWERMYPAYAASEAVLASENLHFRQHFCDNEAYNACIHPFVRNTVGSMDFGGSTLNKWYNATNTPGKGSQRKTSDVFALATSVLFQSPVQHFALAPNNLTDAPAWAVDFMKEVPTTWDDVKFIDGYPGRYLVMARRHGNKWYVCGINAQPETVKMKLDLSRFNPGTQVQMYSDSPTLQGSLNTVKLKKGTTQVSIPQNGAFVIVI